MTELRGARVLLTGANGGLGRAIAAAVRSEGAELTVSGRREPEVRSIADEVGAKAVIADLAVPEDNDRLLAEAGDVDVFIANAALAANGELQEWTQDQVDRALAVNLASPIAVTRALLPGFLGRGSGHFVYISSLAGKVPTKSAPLYSATKFGLRGFAGALRADLTGTGVGCSIVFPGFIGEAGMFALSGAKLPFGVRTVSPRAVAAGVVKAIRSNRAELDVAPVPLRIGALIGSLAPGLSAAIQARTGNGMTEDLIAAHCSNR
jgi:short-subunit dehydrogenase